MFVFKRVTNLVFAFRQRSEATIEVRSNFVFTRLAFIQHKMCLKVRMHKKIVCNRIAIQIRNPFFPLEMIEMFLISCIRCGNVRILEMIPKDAIY